MLFFAFLLYLVIGMVKLLNHHYSCAQALSHVWLFATPWTIACQAPLSMEFSRQENCLPCPLPGDLPDPGIKLASFVSPALTSGFPLPLSVQFISVTQSCPTLCDPMNRSTPDLPVHHQLPEFTQTHVHWVGDGIQPSHSLSSPSPLAFNLSQHQCLFKWVISSHQVARVLEFQLQHQSFQWTLRTDLL